jgi:hypothetical protein
MEFGKNTLLQKESLTNELNEWLQNKLDDEALIRVLNKREKDNNLIYNKLKQDIKEIIIQKCTASFHSALEIDISDDRKEFIWGYEKTYLDYLSTIIFHALSNQKIHVNLQSFILPGNYEEGNKLFMKYYKDFIYIENFFGINYRQATSVNIGFALEFTVGIWK